MYMSNDELKQRLAVTKAIVKAVQAIVSSAPLSEYAALTAIKAVLDSAEEKAEVYA